MLSWNDLWLFLEKQGLPLSLEQRNRLERDLSLFLELLLKKNEVLNLTAIRDPREALWKHLADSLVLSKCEPMGAVLDWGSGGGIPGIPFALLRRAIGVECPVYFVDSIGKKIRAIEEFCLVLGVGAGFFHSRGEALFPLVSSGELPVSSVVMRAVAPPAESSKWIHPAIPSWIMMCGPQQEALWDGLGPGLGHKGFRISQRWKYELPEDIGQRVLLKISRQRST